MKKQIEHVRAGATAASRSPAQLGVGMVGIPVVTGDQLVQAFPVARESQGGGELPRDERYASCVATIRDLDRISIQFAADLVGLAVVEGSRKRNVDYVTRDSVLGLVAAWRATWDKNSAQRMPIDRAALAQRAASVPAQEVQQPALKVVCYHMVDGDDHETNGIDQFSGGRTGGTPLVALPDALSAIAAAAHAPVAAPVADATMNMALGMVDACMDATQVEPEDAAAWQIVRSSLAAPVPAASVQPFQQRVLPWVMVCFGAEIAADTKERNHRFFEESTELVQAHGMTASEAHQLVDYVYGRPVGEPAQEVGGVMVTLAALCLANGLDMDEAAETELARIWTKVEAIRAKQVAKPKHSPLPQAVQPASGRDVALLEQAAQVCDQQADGTNGPYRTACLQCANALRALRDTLRQSNNIGPTSSERDLIVARAIRDAMFNGWNPCREDSDLRGVLAALDKRGA